MPYTPGDRTLHAYHVGNDYTRGSDPGTFEQKQELRRNPRGPGFYRYTPPVKLFTREEIMAEMRKVRSHTVTIGIVGYLDPQWNVSPPNGKQYDGGRIFLGRIKQTLYAYEVLKNWSKGINDVRDALAYLTDFPWIVIEAVYFTERHPLQNRPVVQAHR